MRVLSVDPGKTAGFVIFEVSLDDQKPMLLASWEQKAVPLGEFVRSFLRVLPKVRPQIVVLEDYRIYASKAKEHIGAHLLTAELIGALQALCAIVVPPVETTRLSASKKGRWPDARLKAKFPEILELSSPHVRDAAALGLAYLEKEKLWRP